MTAHSPGLLARAQALAVFVALGLVVGCTGKERVQDIYTPGAAPAEASVEVEGAPMDDLADAYEGGDMSSAERREDRAPNADGALDLASYERLLAQQEVRLRSAGVAMRGDPMFAENGAGEALDSTAGLTGDVGSSPSGGSTATSKSASRPNRIKKKKKTQPVGNTGKQNADAPMSTPSGYGRGSLSPEAEPNQCSTICDLAASTCDLERQICDLASRHPDEDRYAQVCARAADDCLLARNACQACPV